MHIAASSPARRRRPFWFVLRTARPWLVGPLIVLSAVALTACDRKVDKIPPIGSAPGAPTLDSHPNSPGANGGSISTTPHNGASNATR